MCKYLSNGYCCVRVVGSKDVVRSKVLYFLFMERFFRGYVEICFVFSDSLVVYCGDDSVYLIG